MKVGFIRMVSLKELQTFYFLS
jgi:CDK inhibitor PHO81